MLHGGSLSAFAALALSEKLEVVTERPIETFVCQLHEPGSTVVDVSDLRWKIFTKKQVEAQKLSPTREALHEAIAQAHYQAMVWRQNNIPHFQLPPATMYRRKEEGNRLVSTHTNKGSSSFSHSYSPHQI